MANVIGMLPFGATISFQELVGNFYRIDYQGKIGYIHNSFGRSNK